jgi:hypothetical protein
MATSTVATAAAAGDIAPSQKEESVLPTPTTMTTINTGSNPLTTSNATPLGTTTTTTTTEVATTTTKETIPDVTITTTAAISQDASLPEVVPTLVTSVKDAKADTAVTTVASASKQEDKSAVVAAATATSKEGKGAAAATTTEAEDTHKQFLELLLQEKHDSSIEILKTEADWNRFQKAEISFWILANSKDLASLAFIYNIHKLFIPRRNEINDLNQVRYGLCLDQSIPLLRHWNSQFADLTVLPTVLVFQEGTRVYMRSKPDPNEVRLQIQRVLIAYTHKRLQQLAKSTPAPSPPQPASVPATPLPPVTLALTPALEEKTVTFNTQDNKTHVYSSDASNSQPARTSRQQTGFRPQHRFQKNREGNVVSRKPQRAQPGQCHQSLESVWQQQEIIDRDQQKQQEPKNKKTRTRRLFPSPYDGEDNKDSKCFVM